MKLFFFFRSLFQKLVLVLSSPDPLHGMCVYVYTCLCVLMYACMHSHVCVHVCMYVYVCVHVCIHIYVCVCAATTVDMTHM